VLKRRGKGNLHGYFSRIYLQSRQGLGELLLDGVLTSRGLIDREKIKAYLDRPNPKGDPGFYRLFDLADMEAWLRGWSAG
jgi:asparagine synthase (glutamine-hydrolysing)